MGFSPYTTKEVSDILKVFHTEAGTGITNAEAVRRISLYGKNELGNDKVVWWRIFLRQLRSPFVYLLFGAATLALLLGEGVDAAMIAAFIGINSFLGFYQEYRSEKTLALLKRYTVTRARTRREEKESLIDATLLVPGDIILVKAGDIVPADIRFIEINSVSIDESALTGESAPVEKTATPLAQEVREYHKASNIGFSGTTLMGGEGVGVVIGTGMNSAVGAIAHLASGVVRESAFEAELGRLSSFILKLVILTLVFVFGANILLKGGGAEKTIELLIFSIALAVSVVPEALPLVTTFSLSRGAMRLARNKVIVKRLSAIEDMGSIEVLCTDKTGTLTENALHVKNFYTKNEAEALLYGSLGGVSEEAVIRDPNNAFDIALSTALSPAARTLALSAKKLAEIPFDPKRRINSTLVSRDGAKEIIIRGAPEAILPRLLATSSEETAAIYAWIAAEGSAGRRTIAIARKSFTRTSYTLQDEAKQFTLVGCISFEDAIKKSTIGAVKKAEHLGVSIKMLTGDSKDVAATVAREIGLIKNVKEVVTGEELELLPLSVRREVVLKTAVFARVSPEQKYEIISLIAERRRVGFLGEGINDAPALRAAHVAIAVHGAADIARGASDIILTERSLDVIIDGIEEGRRVFGNTVKYIRATLASNFGNFYAVAIASLFIPFLPMLPVQILLVNLLSDFPMIAVATDTVDDAELRRPNGYHIKEIALIATFLGLVSTTFDFFIFGLFRDYGADVLQTNWFIASILTELAFLFSIRTKLPFFRASMPSTTVIVLSLLAAITTIAFPYTNIGREVFHFVPPSTTFILWILATVAIYFVVTESVKIFYYRIVDSGEKSS